MLCGVLPYHSNLIALGMIQFFILYHISPKSQYNNLINNCKYFWSKTQEDFFFLLIKLILSPGIFPLKIQILPLNKLCIKGEIYNARNRNRQTHRWPRPGRHSKGNTQNSQNQRGRPLADNIDTGLSFRECHSGYCRKTTYQSISQAVRVLSPGGFCSF